MPVLKLEGRYARVAARVAAKWRMSTEMEIGQIGEQDVGALEDVLDWYQERHGRIGGTLEQHARRLGL